MIGVGTSVSVLGTTSDVQRFANGTRSDPHWTCYIDGISIGQMSSQMLCDQKVLRDGTHEITVHATTKGQTFWFDSVHFVPSPSTSYESVVLLIDNQDPAIRYDSKWQPLKGTGQWKMTNVLGAELRFNFTGTWYALLRFLMLNIGTFATT